MHVIKAPPITNDRLLQHCVKSGLPLYYPKANMLVDVRCLYTLQTGTKFKDEQRIKKSEFCSTTKFQKKLKSIKPGLFVLMNRLDEQFAFDIAKVPVKPKDLILMPPPASPKKPDTSVISPEELEAIKFSDRLRRMENEQQELIFCSEQVEPIQDKEEQMNKKEYKPKVKPSEEKLQTSNSMSVYAFPKNKGSSKFLDKCIKAERGFMILRKDQSYYTVYRYADARHIIDDVTPIISSSQLAKTSTLGKFLYTIDSNTFIVARNADYLYVLQKTMPVTTMQVLDPVTDRPVLYYGRPVMFPETVELPNKSSSTPMFRKVGTAEVSGNTGINTTPNAVEADSYLLVLLKIENALTRIANALELGKTEQAVSEVKTKQVTTKETKKRGRPVGSKNKPPKVKAKKVGRPKGSKNKVKARGRSKKK